MKKFEHEIQFKDRKKLPASQVLYGVYSKETLLYIGLTWNLKQRFARHHKFENFVEHGAIKIKFTEYENREQLHDDEHFFINKYKPKLNIATHRRSTARPNSRFNISREEVEKLLNSDCTCLKVTHALLWEYVDSAKTRIEAYECISKDTGLSVPWISRFHIKPDFEPGVDKIERLCVYFTGKTLLDLLQ